MRILCDVDGVLSDFVGLILEYAHRVTGAMFRREAVDRWDCFAAIGMHDRWPAFRTWCDATEACREMAELPGAREFYAELRHLGTVRVCTTPMTVEWLSQRAAWLEGFGVPLKEQIQAHDKQELAGAYDVLIDDRVENCEAFVRAGGRAFCLAAPYNTALADSPTIPRGTHLECLAWLRGLR